MLNPQNTFLDVQEFNNNTNISILEYNALKSCIPGSWKKIFIHKNNVAQNQPLEPSLLIGTIRKTISITKSKELYNSLIMNKIKPPTSLET